MKKNIFFLMALFVIGYASHAQNGKDKPTGNPQPMSKSNVADKQTLTNTNDTMQHNTKTLVNTSHSNIRSHDEKPDKPQLLKCH
jgi:hypothetical protein